MKQLECWVLPLLSFAIKKKTHTQRLGNELPFEKCQPSRGNPYAWDNDTGFASHDVAFVAADDGALTVNNARNANVVIVIIIIIIRNGNIDSI